MKDANPRARVTRLINESNHLGAYMYLKGAELERDEYVELVGLLAGAVADELSRTRRDDRERIYFLRSILAWILRDVPGLGSLYREQLRESRGGGGLLSSFARGLENAGDVTSGRKTVSDGFRDAADDVRRNIEDAADAVKSGDAGAKVNDFLSSAEERIRTGLDQLADFFGALNAQSGGSPDPGSHDGPDDSAESDAQRAARADAEHDVEDAAFESDESDEPENREQ